MLKALLLYDKHSRIFKEKANNLLQCSAGSSTKDLLSLSHKKTQQME
jgi:hypothetical protein